MEKNTSLRLKIEDVTNLGTGVAHCDGETVFVPGGVTGDEINGTVIKCASDYCVAKLDELLKASPYRAENTCESYKSCGGCVFRHIDYEYEKKIKYDYVVSAFRKIAGTDITPEEVVTYSPDGYRNNVRFPVGQKSDGRLFPGFYAERSHRVVETQVCLTQKRCFDKVVPDIFRILNRYVFTAYNEETGKGYLRHVCMRCNVLNQIALCLVINGAVGDKLHRASEEICKMMPQVISVHANINKKNTNVIFGEETQLICGRDGLREKLCGKTFNISPRSFFQVNTETAGMLFDKAAEYLRLGNDEVLLDMYCGTGTIGLALSGKSNRLFGCEIIPEAVKDAEANAVLNGIGSCSFVCGDAADGVSQCVEKYGRIDAITVDPPRKGLSAESIEAICGSGVSRFVYISCNPDTLARDTAVFAEKGYMLEKAALFDLFPRTSHVETAALFVKKASERI